MKKLILGTLLLFLSAAGVSAQTAGGIDLESISKMTGVDMASLRAIACLPDTLWLWPDGAEEQPGTKASEAWPAVFAPQSGERGDRAMLRIFHPLEPNGVCIMMCPGGGYEYESDATPYASWLTSLGYTFCILNYRLPAGNPKVPISDALEAMRMLRERSEALGVSKVGVMGDSAGGHLASTLATHYDSPETRPDFQILIYPVITMDEGLTHAGSRAFLLGDNPSTEDIGQFSNELHVSPDTPEAFIVLSSDDGTVSPKNSTLYFNALVENGIPCSMHVYPQGGHKLQGGHGWGMGDFVFKRDWTGELEKWLSERIL